MIVPINQIKPNENNPRILRDRKFEQLKQSLIDFPEMLEKRPLVCYTDTDGKYVILGGNMRFKCAKEIGIKELPITLADDWTMAQREEFLIKDNIGFGEWDWDRIANEWDTDKVEAWGLDFVFLNDESNTNIGEDNKPAIMKITFENVEQLQKAETDIQELLDRKYEGAFYKIT